MKIAQLTPNSKPIPSPKNRIYAPGLIVGAISDGMTEKGHEVFLFAGKDSKTKAKIMYEGNSLFSDYGDLREPQRTQYELTMASKCFEMARDNKFDIVHAHDHTKVIYFANFVDTPIVFTFHGDPEDDLSEEIDRKRLLKYRDRVKSVAVSDFQVKNASKYFNFIDRVYHGIDISRLKFNAKPKDHMLFLGRMVDRKGPDIALDIAKSLNKKIVLAGEPYSKEDKEFFVKIQTSMKNQETEYLGHIPFDKVGDIYRQSKVFMMPIRKNEAFGLVMIEAMACGTPVVVFDRGSAGEIVKDGVTGFVVKVDDNQAMAKAVQKIYNMPENQYQKMRENCRKHVEEKFSIQKMVDGYEKVYQKIIKQ
ncbi:glycosyltransferase [Patescibacteria group bacterium]